MATSAGLGQEIPASADAAQASETGETVEPNSSPDAYEPIDEANDAEILGASGQTWQVERTAVRFGVFAQEGRGYQSQASPDDRGRGTEEAWIFQPILSTRIRQDDRVVHDITIPVDIVTSASTDALDAISTASRDNEAVTLDVATSITGNEDTVYRTHFAGHVEETLRSIIVGGGMNYELADDNAVLSINVEGVVDIFDPVQPNGWDPGLSERVSVGLFTGLSQLLSPTTQVAVSYGLTAQFGTIMTTWNSVPVDGGGRLADLFPASRLRHALTGRLSQAIPLLDSFVHLSYRYYIDDFGIEAHSTELAYSQMLGSSWAARLSYRYHTQTGARFFMTQALPTFDPTAPRTADSDLAELDAHEGTAALRWYYDEGGALSRNSSFMELSYAHYQRTNNLLMNVVSLGWSHGFN